MTLFAQVWYNTNLYAVPDIASDTKGQVVQLA